MSKESLREFEVAGFSIDKTARGMPEPVKARFPREPLQAEPIDDRVQDVFTHNIRMKRRTVPFAENECVRLLVMGIPLVMLKDAGQHRPQRDSPYTSLLLEVHMLPLEGKQFPQAQACERNKSNQRHESIRSRPDNVAHLFRRPDRFFFFLDLRHVRFADRRTLNDILLHRGG